MKITYYSALLLVCGMLEVRCGGTGCTGPYQEQSAVISNFHLLMSYLCLQTGINLKLREENQQRHNEKLLGRRLDGDPAGANGHFTGCHPSESREHQSRAG